jgi:hypothetical protein
MLKKSYRLWRLGLFAFRPPCPVECAAYSSGVTGKQKIANPLRSLRLSGELLLLRFHSLFQVVSDVPLGGSCPIPS